MNSFSEWRPKPICWGGSENQGVGRCAVRRVRFREPRRGWVCETAAQKSDSHQLFLEETAARERQSSSVRQSERRPFRIVYLERACEIRGDMQGECKINNQYMNGVHYHRKLAWCVKDANNSGKIFLSLQVQTTIGSTYSSTGPPWTFASLGKSETAF